MKRKRRLSENEDAAAEERIEETVETVEEEMPVPEESVETTPAVETETEEEKSVSFPALLTVSPSPHLRNHETTRSVMLEVIIALIPALIWGVFVFGFRALTITFISVASCVLLEAICQKLLKRKVTVSDLSAALTGLLIALNVPVSVPLWIPCVASFFAIVVVKQAFGGIGKNIVNPAMAGRVFAMMSWAGYMTRFTNPGARFPFFGGIPDSFDAITSATPLASLKGGNIPTDNLLDLFTGNMGGCIGEVSAVLLLLGGVYLMIRKIISWHIPVAFIGTVAVITFIFPKGGEPLNFMLYEILSGGLMLGALFMATDYATSPIAPVGRLIFGVGCGIITVMIRYFGGYPEGVSFAILIMNLLVWYIDNAFKPRRFGSDFEKKANREKKDA